VDGGGELAVFREGEGSEIPARDGFCSVDAQPVLLSGGEAVEDLEALQPLFAQQDEAVCGELLPDIVGSRFRLSAA